MLKSSRPVHWFRLLLGPKPKIPAWSISKGVWKPLSAMMGMSGRAFSRRIAASAAWTSARREASSGRLVRAIGIRSSSARPGSIRVIWRWSCSSGSTTARGSSRSTCVSRRSGPATAAAPRRPAARGRRACSGPGRPRTSGTRSRLRVAIRSTRSCPRSTHVEGAGIHPPVLVHHEVGVGGLEQGVVLRGLDVPVPGVQDLPGHQGLVDGIGRGDDPQVVSPSGRHRRRRSSCSARSGCPC